jgi:hypothetical protein
MMEAISSTAASHDDDCACDVCKAAGGDTRALGRVMLEAYAAAASEGKEGS